MSERVDTPGRLLAAARVRAGLTLGDVSTRSRVPVAALEAIDADDYRRIAAPVYVRGFVRLYAREVGVDPEVPIALLDAALAESVVTGPAAPPVVEPNPAGPRPTGQHRRRTRAMYSVAAVTLLAVLVLVLFSATQGPTVERELAPDTPTAAPVVVPLPVEVVDESGGAATPTEAPPTEGASPEAPAPD